MLPTQIIITLILIFLLFYWLQQSQTKQKTRTMEQAFAALMDDLNKNEKVDDSIIGFNFGLFETSTGFTMYLLGSKTFDVEDEDWATNVDFEPKQKYFQFGKEFSANKDWQQILKISEKLILDYIASENFKTSIFTHAKGITTGFDDGNLTILKAND